MMQYIKEIILLIAVINVIVNDTIYPSHPTLASTIFIISLIVSGILVLSYTFPIMCVRGRSMLPTFQDGSILITTRLFNRYKLKEGQVYVYSRLDEDKKKYSVVKRLTKKHAFISGLCYFEGDNPTESYDSRQYGYVNAEDIKAKVLWQISK